MKISITRDKKIIESHFRKNTDLNIYSIGDLDDFFFKYTKWFSIGDENAIQQIALLYEATNPPTFIAHAEKNFESMFELVSKVKSELPVKIYAHLSIGLVEAFGNKSILKNNGRYFKMSMKNENLLLTYKEEKIKRLSSGDINEINELYKESYGENFFDSRMLETGKYFGYYDKDKLIGIAGIHVYSKEYKIATLGNITINTNYRGKSICQKLTSKLCKDLLETVDDIGLNVNTQNLPAINCYKKIGFEIIEEYEEFLIDLSEN